MSKKGFLKFRLYSLQKTKIDVRQCSVKAKSVDAQVTISMTNQNEQHYYFLPVSQILQLSILGGNESIGYFELPLKKLYEHPHKKHLITVNCITKDTQDGNVKPDVFGVLKISIEYLENQIAKLDILIQQVIITQDKANSGVKELFVQCTVGNVSSQTTVKKSKQAGLYEWQQVLPFTLQAIPGRLDLLIKDKDMVNDEILCKVVIDPQRESMFGLKEVKKQTQFKMNSQEDEVILKLMTNFTMHQS